MNFLAFKRHVFKCEKKNLFKVCECLRDNLDRPLWEIQLKEFAMTKDKETICGTTKNSTKMLEEFAKRQ